MKIINILWSLLYYTMNILCNYVSDVNFTNKNIKFPKINKISSNQYKALALRPKNSCLNDTKFKIINEFNQINWKKHLANMLEEIFNK